MNNYNKRQLHIAIACLFLLLMGIMCLILGYNNIKTVSLKYKEDNNIDYKVYLKDNEFFESKYIDKGKTYITSLIDHIHVDYQYNVTFNEKVKGTYKYKVVAQLEANKADNENGNYWTKKYDVTTSKEGKLNGQASYTINESVDVDYNKYNQILEKFRKSVGLTSYDGVLKVYLQVQSNVEGKQITTPVNSDLMLKLPLSQLAIEATIDSDVNNNIQNISKTIRDKNPIYLIATLFGMISVVIAAGLIWVLIRNRRIYEIGHRYDLEIKRIKTTYDSILVNVEDLPDMSDYNLIKVESFDELIDAHSEVRMPINYYQTDDCSIFLLFNDSTAWEYMIERKEKRRSSKK